MGALLEIDSNNFEQEVIRSDKPVLVDFFGAWCGPCRLMEPMLEEFGEEQSGRLKIVKFDTKDHEDFVAQYRVYALPNLILFSGGQPIGQRTGLVQKTELGEWIDDTLR